MKYEAFERCMMFNHSISTVLSLSEGYTTTTTFVVSYNNTWTHFQHFLHYATFHLLRSWTCYNPAGLYYTSLDAESQYRYLFSLRQQLNKVLFGKKKKRVASTLGCIFNIKGLPLWYTEDGMSPKLHGLLDYWGLLGYAYWCHGTTFWGPPPL